MGKIGDYVHLHAANYQRFGITKDKSYVAYTYSNQHKRVNARMHQSKLKNKTRLEKTLKFLQTNAPEDPQVREIQKVIESLLLEKFGESMGTINWETFDVTAAKGSANKLRNSITQTANQKAMEMRTLLLRVRTIEELAAQLYKTDKLKAQELYTQVNKIYKVLKNATSPAQSLHYLKDLRTVSPEAVPHQLVAIDKLVMEDGQGMVPLINNILKTYSGTPAINLQKGDLFEYLIAIAPIVARRKATVNLTDTLRNTVVKSVVGSDRSHVRISFENFSDEINLSTLNFRGFSNAGNDNTMVSFGTSQDKIDVNLSWGGSTVPVSAKNVNLQSSRGVHIVSGTSLLYLIQDEDSDFVNHYLNIVAMHPDDPMTLDIAMHGVKDAMKYTILFKALSGGTYGRNAAEVFIVNDNKTKDVHIYEIQDLLLKAENHLNTYSEITANGASIDNLKIANKRASTYSERITNFISNVHAQKISAALKPSLLS